MASHNGTRFNDNYPAGVEDHFKIKANNAIMLNFSTKAEMTSGTSSEIDSGRGIVVEHLRNNGLNCTRCKLAKVPVPKHLAPDVAIETEAPEESLPNGKRHDPANAQRSVPA